MKTFKEFCLALVDPIMMPTAIKVALLVGSILFSINHGVAVVHGQMTRDRWISALLTYLIPYTVNIYGQFAADTRQRQTNYLNQDRDELTANDSSTPAEEPQEVGSVL
ncbi:MAG: nitrate/nitrite transporter NrtS [Cyanosarcina radialis HA8281-LM2]|jgi:hypothetical protein|nr:nitrate/nitrite transporter NrtS [Cyanosarcina radialis HA8281-LM2]